jgi:CheY-like chemotaxis protein
VVHELVTNARKYGALSTVPGIVTVETSLDEVHNVLVSWRESGGPAVTQPTRRGFGSTLIEQLIPFEMNGTSNPRFLRGGFVLDVLLPAAMAEAMPSSAISGPAHEAALTAVEEKALVQLLRTCLVVEDNLFIALDAEDMLRSIGGGKVVLASSIAEAQAAIVGEKFSFALLDVNLGSDNSLPIARALIAKGVPFALGTGYGEALALPDTMTSTTIVSKPYHRIALMKALVGMMRRERESPVGTRHCS